MHLLAPHQKTPVATVYKDRLEGARFKWAEPDCVLYSDFEIIILMFKTALSRIHHRHIGLVAGFNGLIIVAGATRLDHG